MNGFSACHDICLSKIIPVVDFPVLILSVLSLGLGHQSRGLGGETVESESWSSTSKSWIQVCNELSVVQSWWSLLLVVAIKSTTTNSCVWGRPTSRVTTNGNSTDMMSVLTTDWEDETVWCQHTGTHSRDASLSSTHIKLFLRLIIYIILQSRAWPGNDKQLETPPIMLEFRLRRCVKNSHWSKRWKRNVFTLKIPFAQQVVNSSVNTVNVHTQHADVLML